MHTSRQQLAGILVGLTLAVADETLANGQTAAIISLLTLATLLLIGCIRGQHSPVWFRTTLSVLILYWAYGTCITGRTMEPHLTGTTFGLALFTFFFAGVWPGLALLRLWPLRIGVRLLLALFPTAFLIAALVADTEERLFVQKHRLTGIGPTARWTVPQHWLAYDQKAQRLTGSD